MAVLECECAELTGECRHDCPDCGGEGIRVVRKSEPKSEPAANWREELVRKAEAALAGLPNVFEPYTPEQLRTAMAFQLGKSVLRPAARVYEGGAPVYNRDLDVTAGELRERGCAIPENVPDCAWIPMNDVDWRQTGTEDPDVLTMEASFRSDFRWVTATVDLKR